MVDVLAVLAMLFQQTINGGYTVLAASVLNDKSDPITPEVPALTLTLVLIITLTLILRCLL